MKTNTILSFLVFSLISVSAYGVLGSSEADVGCLFQDSICKYGQFCYEDNALGKCISLSDPKPDDYYRYDIHYRELIDLKGRIVYMKTQGFDLSHPYTQCMLKLRLATLRNSEAYEGNPSCDAILPEERRSKPPQPERWRDEYVTVEGVVNYWPKNEDDPEHEYPYGQPETTPENDDNSQFAKLDERSGTYVLKPSTEGLEEYVKAGLLAPAELSYLEYYADPKRVEKADGANEDWKKYTLDPVKFEKMLMNYPMDDDDDQPLNQMWKRERGSSGNNRAVSGPAKYRGTPLYVPKDKPQTNDNNEAEADLRRPDFLPTKEAARRPSNQIPNSNQVNNSEKGNSDSGETFFGIEGGPVPFQSDAYEDGVFVSHGPENKVPANEEPKKESEGKSAEEKHTEIDWTFDIGPKTRAYYEEIKTYGSDHAASVPSDRKIGNATISQMPQKEPSKDAAQQEPKETPKTLKEEPGTTQEVAGKKPKTVKPKDKTKGARRKFRKLTPEEIARKLTPEEEASGLSLEEMYPELTPAQRYSKINWDKFDPGPMVTKWMERMRSRTDGYLVGPDDPGIEELREKHGTVYAFWVPYEKGSPEFERHERLDVKKPGPAFDKVYSAMEIPDQCDGLRMDDDPEALEYLRQLEEEIRSVSPEENDSEFLKSLEQLHKETKSTSAAEKENKKDPESQHFVNQEYAYVPGVAHKYRERSGNYVFMLKMEENLTDANPSEIMNGIMNYLGINKEDNILYEPTIADNTFYFKYHNNSQYFPTEVEGAIDAGKSAIKTRTNMTIRALRIAPEELYERVSDLLNAEDEQPAIIEINMDEEIPNDRRGMYILSRIEELLHFPQYTLLPQVFEARRLVVMVGGSIRKELDVASVSKLIGSLIKELKRENIHIISVNPVIPPLQEEPQTTPVAVSTVRELPTLYRWFIGPGALTVAMVVLGVLACRALKAERLRQKLKNVSDPLEKQSKENKETRRSKKSGKPAPDGTSSSATQRILSSDASPSSRSSTSSWTEEPMTNMDITTGHMVLAYMENHLKNRARLDGEWGALCCYEPDPRATTVAHLPENVKKNRYVNCVPYDHARVILNALSNIHGSDYINASTIFDHDPRNPVYIATQGPLIGTSTDFWQMIWEQGTIVIVMLTRLLENDVSLCHRYWPNEGSELYNIYEVHLVSEHIWCDDYLVRSLYLKNLKTTETRTVTQFHFLTWEEGSVPLATKPLLEFRRKVNKSFRGRSSPTVVHCSDGVGRTGAYILLDMVLNRISKGAKEIDIAATLEHIRDQRAGAVATKQQFQFVLTAVAEEVQAILRALPQQQHSQDHGLDTAATAGVATTFVNDTIEEEPSNGERRISKE